MLELVKSEINRKLCVIKKAFQIVSMEIIMRKKYMWGPESFYSFLNEIWAKIQLNV